MLVRTRVSTTECLSLVAAEPPRSAHLHRKPRQDQHPRDHSLRRERDLERGRLKQTRQLLHLRQKIRPLRRVPKLQALQARREERDLRCPDTKPPVHLQKQLQALQARREERDLRCPDTKPPVHLQKRQSANPPQAQTNPTRARRPKALGRKAAKALPFRGPRRRQLPSPPKMRPPPRSQVRRERARHRREARAQATWH